MIRFSFRIDLEFEDSVADGHGGLESFHRWTEESLADFCTGYCKGRRLVRRLEPAAWFSDQSESVLSPPKMLPYVKSQLAMPVCVHCGKEVYDARIHVCPPEVEKRFNSGNIDAEFPDSPHAPFCHTCSGGHDERDCPNVAAVERLTFFGGIRERLTSASWWLTPLPEKTRDTPLHLVVKIVLWSIVAFFCLKSMKL